MLASGYAPSDPTFWTSSALWNNNVSSRSTRICCQSFENYFKTSSRVESAKKKLRISLTNLTFHIEIPRDALIRIANKSATGIFSLATYSFLEIWY
jgi:hypothetical protein